MKLKAIAAVMDNYVDVVNTIAVVLDNYVDVVNTLLLLLLLRKRVIISDCC
jgi:predicted membrane-bound dolichyl-phosphate-mannose-protein mannosyltransferase